MTEDDRGLRSIVHELVTETAEDDVGLWRVHQKLDRLGEASTERIVQIVAQILHDDRIQIGQFSDAGFEVWPERGEARLARLQRELEELGHAPNIGEVAWLVQF